MNRRSVVLILHPSSFILSAGGIFLLHFPYPCVGGEAELGRWALPTTEVRKSPDFPLSAAMRTAIVQPTRGGSLIISSEAFAA